MCVHVYKLVRAFAEAKKGAGCPALSPSILLSFEIKPLTEPGVKVWSAILSRLPVSTIHSIRVTDLRGHNLLFT